MTTAYYGPGRFTTAGGTLLDARDPSFASPPLEDVCICLSHINRFGGHVPHDRTMSVAAHSLFVGRMAETITKNQNIVLAAYIHDFAEIITGDVIGPMKFLFGPQLKIIENIWNAHFEQTFSLPPGTIRHPVVKHADETSFHLEDHCLKGSPLHEFIHNKHTMQEIEAGIRTIRDLSAAPPRAIAELLVDAVKDTWAKAC